MSNLPALSQFAWRDIQRAGSSVGLRAGAQLYLAGISGILERGASDHRELAADVVAQARAAYGRIAQALGAAERSIGDIVKVVEYVVDTALAQYDEVAAVRADWMDGHRPAVNTVIVKHLPDPSALIAIEVTAGSSHRGSTEGWLPTTSESDGVIHLPNVLPLDNKGNVIAPGDIVGQTEAVFEIAAQRLSSMGLSMSHVVMTVDHLSQVGRQNYKHSSKVRQSYLGPVYPAAAGFVMPALPHPGVEIQYEFVATRDAPSKVDVGWSRYAELTYNAAVRAGNLLFMSGQSARDPVTRIMQAPGDVLGQSEYIYSKFDAVLQAAGGSASSIVRLTDYIVPRALGRYADSGAVRQRIFSEPRPTVSSVVCESLMRRDMEIEIIPFAVMDWDRR